MKTPICTGAPRPRKAITIKNSTFVSNMDIASARMKCCNFTFTADSTMDCANMPRMSQR